MLSERVSNQSASVKPRPRVDSVCPDLNFRYLETDRFLVTPNTTRVEIFMDNKAFTETNLTKLFSYLSDKYNETLNLTIIVYTDWSQIGLPVNCLDGAMSGGNSMLEQYDFHEAIFYRRGGAEPKHR